MPGAPSLTPSADQKPGLVAAWALKFSHEDPSTHAAAASPVPVVIGSSDYDADLNVTLQSGLSAGTYTITVYGLSDDHYTAIAATGDAAKLDIVQLYLFYADKSGVVGYLSNLIGLTSSDPPAGALVADLRVKSIKRSVYMPPAPSGGGSGGSQSSGGASQSSGGASQSGGGASQSAGSPAGGGGGGGGGSGASSTPLRRPTLQYTIEVEERVYNLIAPAHRTKPAPADPAATVHAAIDELLQHQLGLQPNTHYKYYPPSSEPATHITFPLEPTIGWQIAYLARANGPLERANAPNSAGRGMLLIRDGVLHIGKRPIPFAGQPFDLTTETGLLQSSPAGNAGSSGGGAGSSSGGAGGAAASAGASANVAGAGGGGAAGRKEHTLVLRGRPDIKPGDVVRFKLPKEDQPATTSSLGALAAIADIASALTGIDETPDTGVYVESVQHQYGRRTGFQTTITGVAIDKDDPSKAWDALGQGTHSTNAPTATATAANAVRASTSQPSASNAQTPPNVGEVRAFTNADSDETHPPGQTERVWFGLSGDSVTSPDIGPNAARRMDVDRDAKSVALGVPYLTPFAFGKCGLVLPRYPKTRVLLAYRKGDPNDPVDLGALWQSGHVPAGAAMGDWWLSLPAKLDGDPLASADDSDTSSDHDDYSGKISQDLIDAAGRRAIDVATLRIRAGSDTLNDVGTKITPAPDGSALVIEHTKNGKTASITIKDDASIEISSDTKITFTSQGDIEMHAQNVKVHVSGKMDVAS